MMMTTSPPPASVAVAASYDSEMDIPFRFGDQEDIVTAVGYSDISFAIFSLGYLNVLLGLFSLSFSTGAGTNKYMAALGAAQ